MYYLGAEHYLENYIIAETKEQYRIHYFWYYWLNYGLLEAISRDERMAADWGIIE